MSNRPAGAVPQAEGETGQHLLLHQYFESTAERWPGRIAVEVPPGIGRN